MHECLTSPSILSELLRLPQTDLKLHNELSSGVLPSLEEQDEELFHGSEDGDNSSMLVDIVVKHVMGKDSKLNSGLTAGGHHLTVDGDGFLARAGLAKTLEASEEDVKGEATAPGQKMASVGR